MLRTHDLVELSSQFRDQRLLTVYLHTSVADPAEQRVWEVELEHALEPLRQRMTEVDRDEHDEFYAAVARLRQWLVAERAALRAPGVVVAVSAGEVVLSTTTATRVPTLAEWGFGLFLSPLIRDASLGTPSAVLLVDLRAARVCRFTPPRHLETVQTLESEAVEKLGDVERRLGAGRSNMGRGTRGGTAAEMAERTLETGRDRMYASAIERATDVAGAHGWILIGGTARSITAARAVVPSNWQARVVELRNLDVHARDSAIMEAAFAAIEAREAERDRELVREIMEEHGARGRGVAGIAATRAMLERASVADLVLSEQFVSAHPGEADDLLDRALAQGATVRQVHGDVATVIDKQGEGVVARLRYPLAPSTPAEVGG